jgi:hypothetical protein
VLGDYLIGRSDFETIKVTGILPSKQYTYIEIDAFMLRLKFLKHGCFSFGLAPLFEYSFLTRGVTLHVF